MVGFSGCELSAGEDSCRSPVERGVESGGGCVKGVRLGRPHHRLEVQIAGSLGQCLLEPACPVSLSVPFGSEQSSSCCSPVLCADLGFLNKDLDCFSSMRVQGSSCLDGDLSFRKMTFSTED